MCGSLVLSNPVTYGLTKGDIYLTMKAELIEQGLSVVVSLSHFYNIWSRSFKKVVIPKVRIKHFRKCIYSALLYNHSIPYSVSVTSVQNTTRSGCFYPKIGLCNLRKSINSTSRMSSKSIRDTIARFTTCLICNREKYNYDDVQ